jgi:hypothetical protein
MAAKKVAPKKAVGPTDEPGQQPTPDSDALAEVEGASAGAGTSLADIAAALRAAGVSASREQLDRAFTRDSFDVDIGYHEGLRFLLLKGFEQVTAMNSVLNHTAAMAGIQAQTVVHARDTDDLNNGRVQNSDNTFHSGLLKSYALETDNEVLSTAALAKIIDNMVQRVERIEKAIVAATP